MWPLLCGPIALLSVVFVYKLLDFILHLPRVGNYSEKHIFITGCDSGFGHELAKRLDLLGCHVFAGCFTEKGETELKKVCSVRLLPVPVDVTDHDSIRKAFEVISGKLLSSGNGLWGMVNIAGTLNSIGPADWLTVSDYRQQCDVNLFGLIDITMTFLPLVKKTQGRIVNMSSNYGLSSYPIFAPYSVSKFGVEAFSDALRQCLKPFGCKTAIIEPGGFKTPLTSTESFQSACDRAWNQCPPAIQEQYTAECAENFRRVQVCGVDHLPADISPVIDALEHALLATRPRPRYRVGSGAQLTAVLSKLPEFIGDWVFAKRMQLPVPSRVVP